MIVISHSGAEQVTKLITASKLVAACLNVSGSRKPI